MKRLLTKVQTSKPFTSFPKTLAGLTPNLSSASPGQIGPHPVAGLQPKYVVPPIPHPCPYDHLALVVTRDGLLIRQHVPGRDHKTERPCSYVRIAWANPVKIEEASPGHEPEGDNVDWSDSVIVYGIIGVLELFSCMRSPQSLIVFLC